MLDGEFTWMLQPSHLKTLLNMNGIPRKDRPVAGLALLGLGRVALPWKLSCRFCHWLRCYRWIKRRPFTTRKATGVGLQMKTIRNGR